MLLSSLLVRWQPALVLWSYSVYQQSKTLSTLVPTATLKLELTRKCDLQWLKTDFVILWAYRQAGLSIQFHSYSRNFGGENFGKLGNLLWICQSFICQLFVIIEAGLKFAKVFFHQIFPALMVCFSSYQLAIVIFSVYNFHVSDRV